MFNHRDKVHRGRAIDSSFLRSHTRLCKHMPHMYVGGLPGKREENDGMTLVAVLLRDTSSLVRSSWTISRLQEERDCSKSIEELALRGNRIMESL